jgi:hypothetical protein
MANVRFEPDPSVEGDKIRNRARDAPVGDFLGRLWTLFGPPRSIDDSGFTYGVRDRQTGLRFTAYSGPSGPAFGGSPKEVRKLAPVLDAFEDLLERTPLSDCSIEIPTSTRRVMIGVENGAPFSKTVHDKPQPFKSEIAKARRVLVKKQQNPMTWFDALLHLRDAHQALAKPPADGDEAAYREVMRELWTKTADASIAELTEELKYPEDEVDRNLLRIILKPTLGSLEDAAPSAGVDWAAFEKRHAAILERARRLLGSRRS